MELIAEPPWSDSLAGTTRNEELASSSSTLLGNARHSWSVPRFRLLALARGGSALAWVTDPRSTFTGNSPLPNFGRTVLREGYVGLCSFLAVRHRPCHLPPIVRALSLLPPNGLWRWLSRAEYLSTLANLQ